MLLWELEQVRVRHESGGRSQERVLIDAGTGTEVGTAAGAGANCPDKPADCRALRVIGWHFNHRRMNCRYHTGILFYVSFYEISGRYKNSSTLSLSQANYNDIRSDEDPVSWKLGTLYVLNVRKWDAESMCFESDKV